MAEELETKDGYTFTLASRLGDMLNMAEKMFGERDKSYTILGTEFYSGSMPQVWYPGNRKDIVIQLTQEALTDEQQACYQLAHESIHLLSPTGGSNANILEEGLATYFAGLYMDTSFPNSNWHPTETKYKEAMELVKKLLYTDSNIIKGIRLKQPVISKITEKDFLLEDKGIDEILAKEIVKEF
jgi:hypothetical protein